MKHLSNNLSVFFQFAWLYLSKVIYKARPNFRKESPSSPAPLWSRASARLFLKWTLSKEFLFVVCFFFIFDMCLCIAPPDDCFWIFLVYRLNSTRWITLSGCLSKRFVLSFISDVGCVYEIKYFIFWFTNLKFVNVFWELLWNVIIIKHRWYFFYKLDAC